MPRVFISSTSPDLDDYRRAAAMAARSAGFETDEQEPWTPDDHPPLEACLEWVRASDMLLVIAAHRCDWIPDDAKWNPDGKSFGWLACEEAEANGRQVLALVVDDTVDWPDDLRDAADLTRATELDDDDAADALLRATRKRIKGLKAFKQWLDAQGLRRSFSTTKGMTQQIEQALQDWQTRHAGEDAVAADEGQSDTAADIFISYSSQDRAWAKQLVDALTDEGWTVWWDLSLRSGKRFDKAIEHQLARARCVLALWSKDAVESDWVRSEVTWAVEQNKLVSVRIQDNITLPLHFRTIQTDSMAGWNRSRDAPAFCKLVADIRALTGRKPPPVPAAYLAWLRRECESVELLGLEAQEQHPTRLSQVYVPAVT